MDLQASSSSSSTPYEFDVFLSFRGDDTRHGFTGHLYKALYNRGIYTFIDDEKLPRGNEIKPSLESAIENSQTAIIVLSENYASSSFCLDELARIMECFKEKDRLVLPIFYDVDPADVRHHRGTYGIALARQEERFKDDKEKVQKWRQALYQVANLAGKHWKPGNEYEYDFIEKIVKVISDKISRVLLHVADYPVGLESPIMTVNKLLNDGSNGKVHVVGIYGVGGIGKTTLARAVYNLASREFECSCFLENVRENLSKNLQEILLSKILGEKDIRLAGVSEGISIMQHRFKNKKVLLVLDNVDKVKQLQEIGRSDWFGFGSKIIITTRDKKLLENRVESKYEVKDLNENEALELLGWHAFKSKDVDPNYMGILNEVVSYASGLPLALEVIGSNLFGRSVEEWKSALDKYRKIPIENIYSKLKVSFDDLEEDEQNLFLDIACCFKGYELANVENILHAHHDVNPKYSIHVLVERSLIKIDNSGFVTLHDLIQDMGREIVRQESRKEPGKRSRLWLAEDIMQVLQENTGTDKIEMINLEASMSEVVEWDVQAFNKMKNLKTLIIRNGNFFQGPKHLPNSLRVLEWPGYPSHSLPVDFHPKKLAILKLSDNCFTSLPLVRLLKEFVNMTVLNFNGNKWITHIPDVSHAPKLQTLDFSYCVTLIKIDESVGSLNELRMLRLWGCKMLRSLPSLMLPSLESLRLSGCRRLQSFPEIIGKMEKLTSLDLSHTSIKELPYSICNLTRLRTIKMFTVAGVGTWGPPALLLPSCIFMFKELNELFFLGFEPLLLLSNQDEGAEKVSSVASSSTKKLDLNYCKLSNEHLEKFLPRFSNLEELDLSGSSFTILPASIKDCRFLRSLELDNCKDLQEIGGIPPNIQRLSACGCTSMSCSSRELLSNKKLHEEGGEKRFRLPGRRIPEWFEHQSSGRSISFWFRNKISAISVCLLFNEPYLDLYPAGLYSQWTVNDNYASIHFLDDHISDDRLDHTYIYDIEADADEEHLENEWNQANISFTTDHYEDPMTRDVGSVQFGLHIIKERSSMDDIRFADPPLQKEEHGPVDMRDYHNHHMPQQQTNLPLLEPHVEQGRELILCLPPPALTDNLNWDSNSELISSSTTITVQDQAATERAPGESCHTPGYAETQSIQAPSPTSLSGKASEEELYLKSSCTASSTSIDKSLRKNETSDDDDDDDDDDDAEMDAFYDSSGAGIPMLSHSHVELATTAPSEEAREALRSVQYFISNDASVLLYPEQCSITKAGLDYLSKLSADDGISREMGKLMSEASRLLTHWSRDYVEASRKIDSITSELQRADELEMSLEGNKEKFREVEQLNATRANMSVSQSERSITRKRKREIFEEGKKLKAQLDDLRKNVPQWEQEHISAKKVQAKIKAEWSKVREIFNKMVEKWNL